MKNISYSILQVRRWTLSALWNIFPSKREIPDARDAAVLLLLDVASVLNALTMALVKATASSRARLTPSPAKGAIKCAASPISVTPFRVGHR